MWATRLTGNGESGFVVSHSSTIELWMNGAHGIQGVNDLMS
jgi:hypothetical protein